MRFETITLMRRLVLCAAFSFAGAAHAQDLAPASAELIHSETRYFSELPGPQPDVNRGIYIWRAPSTPGDQLLPTLYMADGGPGLYIAAARLRPAIEAGLIPPVQIIGLEPDARHRSSEYADFGRARFRAHERWVLDVVIPWAERVARASPQQRAIGGYSNGAAFAIFLGAAHPDVFSAVLAHSPVSAADTIRIEGRADGMRWALSAGRLEYRGYPARAISVVGGAARGRGASVRSCTGAWEHGAEAWIDLSPGAIAWMFDFPSASAVDSALEREACAVEAPR